MTNGIVVTREKFYNFINRYQTSTRRNLKTDIQRPLTTYSDEQRVPKKVCWYNDKSCGSDPDQIGRDYYILEELINFKTREELLEEMLVSAIEKYPIHMTAILKLKNDCLESELEATTGDEYVAKYKEAVGECYDKLFQKTKPAKTVSKVGAKKKKKKKVGK